MVSCQVVQNILTCTISNRVMFQFCNVDDGVAFNCSGAFDISALGLPSGELNISVFVTDIFMQNADFNLTVFYLAPGMVVCVCVFVCVCQYITIPLQEIVWLMESYTRTGPLSRHQMPAIHGTLLNVIYLCL